MDTTLVASRGAVLRTFYDDVAKNLMIEMSDAGQKVYFTYIHSLLSAFCKLISLSTIN